MRCATGANAFARKSNGGAIGLCVPPVIVTVVARSAAHSAGSSKLKGVAPGSGLARQVRKLGLHPGDGTGHLYRRKPDRSHSRDSRTAPDDLLCPGTHSPGPGQVSPSPTLARSDEALTRGLGQHEARLHSADHTQQPTERSDQQHSVCEPAPNHLTNVGGFDAKHAEGLSERAEHRRSVSKSVDDPFDESAEELNRLADSVAQVFGASYQVATEHPRKPLGLGENLAEAVSHEFDSGEHLRVDLEPLRARGGNAALHVREQTLQLLEELDSARAHSLA